MKKILIFFSKTGAGHLRAAEAIAEEIKRTHPDYDVLLKDSLMTTNSGSDFHPDKVFLSFSTTLVFIYNNLYRLTNNPLGTKILRALVKKVFGKSMSTIIDQYKPDLILSTHPSASSQTFSKAVSIPVITVCTDLGHPHRLWFDHEVTVCIVATEKIASYFQKERQKTAKILTLGLPLKKEFVTIPATKEFNNQILVLGGGSGSGNLEEQIAVLSQSLQNIRIIAICGINKQLKEKLEKKQYKNVTIYGFVDNVYELMKASDIILTKAGPGTIMEAVTFHKPLIITSWIVVQEKENVDFVTENNLGVYCTEIKKLPNVVKEIYNNYPTYTNHTFEITNGTQKIVERANTYISS